MSEFEHLRALAALPEVYPCSRFLQDEHGKESFVVFTSRQKADDFVAKTRIELPELGTMAGYELLKSLRGHKGTRAHTICFDPASDITVDYGVDSFPNLAALGSAFDIEARIARGDLGGEGHQLLWEHGAFCLVGAAEEPDVPFTIDHPEYGNVILCWTFFDLAEPGVARLSQHMGQKLALTPVHGSKLFGWSSAEDFKGVYMNHDQVQPAFFSRDFCQRVLQSQIAG